jgi:hypothetical protein
MTAKRFFLTRQAGLTLKKQKIKEKLRKRQEKTKKQKKNSGF